MDEFIFEDSVFRLRPGAVDCDGDGLRLGGHDLLRRQRGNASLSPYALPPIGELEERLWRAYGCRISAAGKVCGLQVVVDALNKGEVARAQIAALLLKLPNPAAGNNSVPELTKRLHNGGWLLKNWDPDKHPRTGTSPNPGWFAPADGGSSDSTSAAPTSAHIAQQVELKPTETAAHGDAEQQVAVLTNNFKYACRVLKLDPGGASDILHQLKEGAGLGGNDNCIFDTETGDVYFNGEHLGNLGD